MQNNCLYINVYLKIKFRERERERGRRKKIKLHALLLYFIRKEYLCVDRYYVCMDILNNIKFESFFFYK